ncbi:MAG: response regulator [Candidatus Krumholzibacteriota bacterium]|nr:response regulator [Candidatus Krumholzibacteriota bacterium]
MINGNVELLLMDIGKGDPLRNEINEIRSASLSAAKLTKQLLAFSRKQPVHMKVLDFATLLDGSRSMLERVLREDIIISLEVKVSGGYVLADSSFLEQIILNMAINSRDAMPEGGTLTFLLDRIVADEQFVSGGVLISPGEYIRLRISDTGTGMTDDCREKIFEPFFTTKTKEKGSGLGLSSVYGMVKQMKGFVTVDSKVGEGAVFSVFLPAVDGMPEKKDAPGRHRRDKVENATLLVVEDDPAVLQFLQRILTRQGYKVLTAIDADSAFERSRSYEKAIDIVITDIVLPGMNGIDLVKKLKKTRQTVRELFISGYFQEEEEGDTLLVPGVNLLQKPFESADLIRIIDQLLSYRDSP